MRILLTGSKGQLGKSIQVTAPNQIGEESLEILATSRDDLDLRNEKACIEIIEKFLPDWVINAGAYTNVDQAESQPELAIAINSKAPEAFSKALLNTGGNLLQLSTDNVFDGQQDIPYKTNQCRKPLNTYGTSKAMGESLVEDLLFESGQGTILRTSWVLSPYENNFLQKILQFHKNKIDCKVVADQVGCSTSSLTLAKTCWRIIELKNTKNFVYPILHCCDKGMTNWFEIALAIGQISKKIGLINETTEVQPILSIDFVSPAVRPKYSLLDCKQSLENLRIEAVYWQSAIESILKVCV
tara:strand:- start:246 stop:1142 length:897 start_codon:yes stop_codon:yes gene_type:complete